MAQKNKSGKITIANIVAMVGIVLLMVFSFIGFSFKSGGEMGISLLKTFGVTAFTALLLWLLIKAKGAENNLKKWKIAEISILVTYLAFTIATSINGGIMYLFVVNGNKQNIKELAKADLEKIDNLFAAYEEFETAAIANTRQGLTNATQPHQRVAEPLRSYLNRNRISAGYVSMHIDNQQSLVLGSIYEEMKRQYAVKRELIETCVDDWNTFLIPFEANKIVELAKESEENLTNLSQVADLKLPVIVLDTESKKYVMESENQSSEFHIEGGIESLKFRQALTENEGYSIAAIIVTVLLHFLILFNYIVAYRTKTISVGKNAEDDGGIIL